MDFNLFVGLAAIVVLLVLIGLRVPIGLALGGVSLIGYGIGALAFTRFGFSEEEHSRIRAELDQRADARATQL